MTVQPGDSLEELKFESFQDIIDAAHLGYIDLSYHNKEGHIDETIKAVPDFCRWALDNGITDVPEEPLKAVMANHDFGVHIPLDVKRTATDEAYSAIDLGRKLIQFSEGRDVLSLAVAGVLATTPTSRPRNNFELGARVLDTNNVCSQDFSVVLKNSYRVIVEEEIELKSRITDSFLAKRDRLATFLGQYYYPEAVMFTAEDGSPVPYEPSFAGMENIKRLGSITEKEFIDIVPEAEATFAILWPKKSLF